MPRQHTELLNDFAMRLVGALMQRTGNVWRVTEPADHDRPSGAVIADDDTHELHLYLGYSDTKVQVSGQWPDFRARRRVHVGDARPSINVGFTRKIDQVAGDIARRFLPAYDETHKAVIEAMAREDEAETSLAAGVATIAAALGVEAPVKRDPWDNQPSDVRAPYRSGKVYGSFRGNHTGSNWHIDLDTVPTELAVEIARLVARYQTND